jgi:hypothetical protein
MTALIYGAASVPFLVCIAWILIHKLSVALSRPFALCETVQALPFQPFRFLALALSVLLLRTCSLGTCSHPSLPPGARQAELHVGKYEGYCTSTGRDFACSTTLVRWRANGTSRWRTAWRTGTRAYLSSPKPHLDWRRHSSLRRQSPGLVADLLSRYPGIPIAAALDHFSPATVRPAREVDLGSMQGGQSLSCW